MNARRIGTLVMWAILIGFAALVLSSGASPTEYCGRFGC